MRAALLSVFILTCGASPALAGPCTGAEAQLAQISRQLTLGSLDGVKAGLQALSLAHPDCPQILLQQARLAEAAGDPNASADLYYRYTDRDPNDSKGLAYFGRFFLEQRDDV